MVSIGGYDFNVGGVMSGFTPIDAMKWIIYACAALTIIAWGGYWIYEKFFYDYPVILRRRRANSSWKLFFTKGGFFKDKRTGAKAFKYKTGWQPWKVAWLKEAPDPQYLDSDNRVWLEQYGANDHDVIQVKMVELPREKEIVLNEVPTEELKERLGEEMYGKLLAEGSVEITEDNRKYRIHLKGTDAKISEIAFVSDFAFYPVNSSTRSVIASDLMSLGNAINIADEQMKKFITYGAVMLLIFIVIVLGILGMSGAFKG